MKYSLNSLKKAHHMKIMSSCKGQQGETQQLSHTFHFHPRDDFLRNRSRIVISILDELWLHALPWEGIYTDDARPESSDSFSFLKQTTKFPCLKPLRLMIGPYMLHWDTLGASMWGGKMGKGCTMMQSKPSVRASNGE